ncbi:helix-turn-helix domain-containing protein [Streptomyces sp. NPDC048825]|uniref:helix-turn-helix domain-containing protein n=1 Tax=Streptomyces sp. NPDC048825 TaxID=3365592 RepID=UPI00371B6405
MADRPAPTARRIRVATELRKLRERAGMTSTEAARQLGTSSGQLSNVETARFGVSAERIRAMASTYDCSDQAFVDALVSLASDRTRGWWEQYRGILPSGLLDLAELEHHATALRTAFTSHVPGLLQTSDHAREIFRHVIPAPTPPEVEHRVSYRIKRQDVLYRANPVPYRTVIHEAALRMKIGGPEVTGAQLRHLLDMSERDHITIRALPFDVGAFPGSGQSINYAYGLVPQLDTVQLDQFHGPVLLDAEAHLDKYRRLLDVVEAAALPPEKSRDFIHHLVQQL